MDSGFSRFLYERSIFSRHADKDVPLKYPRIHLFALLSLATSFVTLPASAQAPAAREIIHYQKNIRVGHSRPPELVREILSFRPDTISLQEIAEKDKPVLDLLRASYPSQHYCFVEHLSGIAALSRWPMVQGTQTCFGGWGIAGFQVEMPEGRVWVLSAHIEVFFEGLRPQILRALIPQLEALDGPAIIGGDFNSEPYFTSTQRLSAAAGVKRIGRPVSTFTLFDRFGVAIDHIMATRGEGIIMQRPKLNSDHYGVVGRFTMGFQ